ncbi:MAG: hypothetical protein AB7K04_16145 [Pseudorhodoplanes sp.]
MAIFAPLLFPKIETPEFGVVGSVDEALRAIGRLNPDTAAAPHWRYAAELLEQARRHRYPSQVSDARRQLCRALEAEHWLDPPAKKRRHRPRVRPRYLSALN